MNCSCATAAASRSRGCERRGVLRLEVQHDAQLRHGAPRRGSPARRARARPAGGAPWPARRRGSVRPGACEPRRYPWSETMWGSLNVAKWRTRSPSRAAIKRRVLAERMRGRPLGPAARVLQRLRQIPVVQRDERVDVAREQLVDQPVVEVEARFVGPADPIGEDPRPGRSRGDTRSARGRPSARRPRGTGGSGRTRRRRCRRSVPAPGCARSGPRCFLRAHPLGQRPRSGRPRSRRPTRIRVGTVVQARDPFLGALPSDDGGMYTLPGLFALS